MCYRHIAGGFLYSSKSDQCALTDAGHRLHLLIAVAVIQKIYSMLQLGGGKFLRPTLTEVWILSGNRLACLGAFYNHTPFVFCEGQHNGENQIARQSILH